MTKKLLSIFALLLVIAGTACNKSDNNDDNNNTACNGNNLCFKMNGTLVSVNAQWVQINAGRIRILWEETSGVYKNIELDIYGTTPGTYPVTNNPGAGGAGFQYFVQTPATNIQGESGAVILTSIANDQLSGTFTIQAIDQTSAPVAITEGQFVNVPKQ